MNFDKLKKDKKNVLLGCPGNKNIEYNKFLKEIILNNINKDTLFIEPFCGSAIISYNLYQTNNIKCHINDIDNFRIDFFNKCKDINYMNEINDKINNINTKEDYYKLVDRKLINKEYNSYIFSRLIHSFRYGLFDETKKKKMVNLNWNDFLNNAIISNLNWVDIIEKYKDDENVFIYLDPPYLSSFNGYYISFNEHLNDNNTIIDNTKMYIDILNYLKNCKCKILFSINNNSITKHIYKEFINNTYNKIYSQSHIKNNDDEKKYYSKNEDILIISNF